VVARTGESLLVEEVTDEMLVAGTRDPEHLRVARELGLRSALSVPLRAHERVLGVLTFVSAESGRRYTAADVPFAEDLGRRGGLAIDNAELYSESRRVTAELQATLAPQELPLLDGWEFADLYQQSGRTEVGGDFYDVAVLPDGRLGVVMGDVMGRGVDAAVAGSRLRTATRVLMTQNPDPAALARAVDRYMEREALIPLASAAYLLLDQVAGEATVTLAGHPPPLLVHADGTTEFMDLARSTLLGVGPGVGPTERVASNFAFEPGDTLVLFTDGLVERRGEDIEQRLEQLRTTVAGRVHDGAWATDPLGEVLAAVADSMLGTERHDDVAVLALRRHLAP
jgi:serine phosphatase RsbU (regulator of sigma subunit)